MVALEISFCWEGEAAFVRGLSRGQSDNREREARHCPTTDRFWHSPGEARKAEKIAQARAESFEAIAREWHAKFSPGWEASHGDRIFRRSKTTFFHGWARGPSAKLRHPRCLQCCIESK